MQIKAAAVEENDLCEHKWAMGRVPHINGAQVLGKEQWGEARRATVEAVIQA